MVCFKIINLMVCELYLNKAAVRIKGKLNVLKVHKDTGISTAFTVSDGSPGTTTAYHMSASHHMLSSLEAGACLAQHCIFSTEPRVDDTSGSQG